MGPEKPETMTKVELRPLVWLFSYLVKGLMQGLPELVQQVDPEGKIWSKDARGLVTKKT